MADILIDVQVKGSKDVTNAVKNVQSLQTNVKRLSDAMKTGALSQRQYYKGIDQLANATGKSKQELRDYATTLRKVEQETKKAKAAQEQEAAAVKAYAQARREAEAANRRYDAEQKAALATQKQHEVQLERLRQKYNPLYAASKLYERSLEEINQALEVGAIGLKQHEVALESLNREYQAFGNGSATVGNRFVQATQQNTRSMGQWSTVTQQAGYQIGDFLVQVQSGTNWMVAFGQQATQVAGTLTLFGGKMVLIGTALGIAIPLITALGAAFMRTSGSGRTLTQTVDELTSATDSFNSVVQTYTLDGLEKLQEKYGDVNEEILRLVENQKFLARAEFNKSLKDTVDMIGEITGARWYDIGISDYASSILNLKDTFNVTKADAELLYKAFEDVGKAEVGSLEQADALARVSDYMRILLESSEDVTDQQLELLRSVIETEDAIRAMQEAAPKANWMSAASAGVTSLYNKIVAALGKVIELRRQATAPDSLGATRPKIRPFELVEANREAASRGQTRPQGRPIDFMSPIPGGGGGGGGGSSGPSPAQQAEEYLQKLEREVQFKQSLVGLSDEQVAIETRREQLVNQLNGYEEGLSDAYTQRIEEVIKTEAETRKLMEAEQQRQQLMNTIEGHIENAFMSMVDGSKSVEDAFKSMLRNIILAVYQQQVAQPAASAIGSLISKVIPSFDGGGFTGYGPRGGGLDGKGGKLAMVHPNETVVDHTKGQSMGGTTVQQNFYISANGDESVKKIIMSQMPEFEKRAKAAVVDAKRKGGSYGRAF